MAAPAILTNIGSLSAKPGATSATTAAIATGTAGSGSVIALLSVGNSSSGSVWTTVTLSDSAGNTYTRLANAFGTSTRTATGIYFVQSPNPLVAASTTFTITTSTSAMSSYDLHVFELDSTVVDVGVGAGGGAATTSATVTSGAPSPAADVLWLAQIGCAAATTVSVSGTWTLVPTGTTAEGTSGGAASTNMSAKNGSMQVLSTTATQTFSGTVGVANGWSDAIAAVKIAAAAPAAQIPDVNMAPMRASGT